MKTAIITLPASVQASLRVARSSQAYQSERIAKKDACFIAYVALYQGGLINDNLLPLSTNYEEDDQTSQQEDLESLINVNMLFNPWVKFARSWRSSSELHRILVELRSGGDIDTSLRMLVPCAIPQLAPSFLHWRNDTIYEVALTAMSSESEPVMKALTMNMARSFTKTLMVPVLQNEAHGDEAEDYTVLWAPDMPLTTAENWARAMVGTTPGADVPQEEEYLLSVGVLYETSLSMVDNTC